MQFSLKPLGDSAIRIGVDAGPNAATQRRLRCLSERVWQAKLPGICDVVPAYTSLTVFYQPHFLRYAELSRHLEVLAADNTPLPLPTPRLFTLPVCYGGDFGPDLEFVAEFHKSTADAVIKQHSQPIYLIQMLGFVPGFPYLSGLPRDLSTPRLPTPRMKVAAGSVGIGGDQTGVYPLAVPAGWRIIGRTPVKLFDPARGNPMLLSAGDYLQFAPIERKLFEQISIEVSAGQYCAQFQPYMGSGE